MTYRRMLMVGSLALTLFGCGVLGTTSGGSRTAKLALPACPPDQVTLEHGWLGPHVATRADGKTVVLFAMTTDDRQDFERWTDQWRRCAFERGIVIEEANR